MDTVMTNQVIQLLQGLKPYLGPKGDSAEKLINTLQVISSPQAQEFMQNLNQLLPKAKISKKILPESIPAAVPAAIQSNPVHANSFSGNFGIVILLVIVFLLWT